MQRQAVCAHFFSFAISSISLVFITSLQQYLSQTGVGVEKVTAISRLNGGKSMVEEGELYSPCFAGTPFSEDC
jgi:hypothetical protein